MPEEKTAEQLRAEIKAELEADHKKHTERLNGEAAASRKELEAATAQLQEFRDKETERERKALEEKGEYAKAMELKDKELTSLKSEATKRENAWNKTRILDKAELAGIKAGMHDPSDIGKFLDTSKLTIGEDGKIAGLDEAVAALKESKPFLFKATETDEERKARERAGASPGSGNGKHGNDTIDWSDPKLDVDAVIAAQIAKYK